MANEKILVIDDEFHIRDSIRLLLEKEGYRVELAGGGREGLAHLQKDDFTVALVDIKMPEMDGLEFLQQAKKIKPALQVIMLTGFPTLENANSALQLGAYGYIIKPFKIEDLLRILERCLEQRP